MEICLNNKDQNLQDEFLAFVNWLTSFTRGLATLLGECTARLANHNETKD